MYDTVAVSPFEKKIFLSIVYILRERERERNAICDQYIGKSRSSGSERATRGCSGEICRGSADAHDSVEKRTRYVTERNLRFV